MKENSFNSTQITIENYLNNLGSSAKEASYIMNSLETEVKNRALLAVADALIKEADRIIEVNAIDVKHAEENGVSPALVDRLTLNVPRIEGIAEGVRQVAKLSDPIGKILSENTRPNGLKIVKKSVPFGVIGIIYESRPNVTVDAFALCFKAGSAVMLRGGSDAVNSNKIVVDIIRNTLESIGICKDVITYIDTPWGDSLKPEEVRPMGRAVVDQFIKLDKYINLLIPRGGAGLIRNVVLNSTIPVIETGTGNCHVFVDESGDFDMALDIIDNAKTQRMGVCNACESLLIHEKIADDFIPLVYKRLTDKDIEIRAEKTVIEKHSDLCKLKEATEEDWGKEYLGPQISLKVVGSVEEAIRHINKYNTHHSESIITANKANAEAFQNGVDAACVYVNASTRFTDGFEFGFGAEIGISTQKMHARGPMALEEICSYKYLIEGCGQIRG